MFAFDNRNLPFTPGLFFIGLHNRGSNRLALQEGGQLGTGFPNCISCFNARSQADINYHSSQMEMGNGQTESMGIILGNNENLLQPSFVQF